MAGCRSPGSTRPPRARARRPARSGRTLRDELSGETFERPGRAGRRRDRGVVAAARTARSRSSGPAPAVRPSRGTHVVVPRDRIPSAYGLTLRIPGRVCFLVPWPDRWVIGTTDLDDDGPAGPPGADGGRDRRDPRQRQRDARRRPDPERPRRGVHRPASAGDRPGGHPGSTVKASREHRIRTDPNGLVRIGGGKYTTYRLMAAQTVDAALGPDVARARPSRTAELPLVGAAPLDELDALAPTARRRDRSRSRPDGPARRPSRDARRPR